MDCEFYYNDTGFWGYGYTCTYKQSQNIDRQVDSDWARKYCWNDFRHCPHYIKAKGGNTGSPDCYLTSACVDAMHLPDNCVELTTLRALRDGYIRNTPEGEMDIQHYYQVAPQIVAKIDSSGETREKVYRRIFNELVQPSVQLIREEKYSEAYALYKQYALELEKKYLSSKE